MCREWLGYSKQGGHFPGDPFDKLAFELITEWRVGIWAAAIWGKSISGTKLADAKTQRWEIIWCVQETEKPGSTMVEPGEEGRERTK